MTPYKNLSGSSNIESYEMGADSITIKFMSGRWKHYLYSTQKTGSAVVEQMKTLAQQGRGLNSYIGRVVKTNFERKW